MPSSIPRPAPPAVIRPARPDEVEALRTLVAAVDASTPYLPREAGEWPAWCGGPDPAAALSRFQARANAAVLVADSGHQGGGLPGGLVGWLGAIGGRLAATRGSVTLALGVAENRRGRGIGTALLAAARRWADTAGIHRLDLTVVDGNEGAAALYRRQGFRDEGTMRRAVRIGAALRDERIMGQVIGDAATARARVWAPLDLPPLAGDLPPLAGEAPAGMVTVRPARPEDATAYALFDRAVRRETPFLLRRAAEGLTGDHDARRFLSAQSRGLGGITLLALADAPRPVVLGAVSLWRGMTARSAHDAGLVLTVRRTVWGRGIGRHLVGAAVEWAAAAGIVRLSAWTLAHNTRARRFAAAAGFDEEALCRRQAKADERYADQVLMGRLL